MPKFYLLLIAMVVAACDSSAPPAESVGATPSPAPAAVTAPVAQPTALEAALAAQPEATQARYAHRHPLETLEFFGIEPGMTVVEALPGGGWYSKILLAYLGPDGHLIGADYALDMWPLFGFFNEEQLAAKQTWVETWTAEAEAWRSADSASVGAFAMAAMPEEMKGTADAVVFIRALHNLHRFEEQGAYLTQALNDAWQALKPGGIFGVVQHEARPDKADDWADGSRGYLKRDSIIAIIEGIGFEFVDALEINANPNDQPGDDDVVWRLPPTFATSREDPELKAQLEQIGESNRMTLRFRKPAA